MSKNRTVLVNDEIYSSLSYLKNYYRKETGRKIGFNDVMQIRISLYARYIRIDDSVRTYIESFVSKMSSYEDVLGITLFGSVAKNTYHDYSDIDLFIVTSANGSSIYERCNSVINSIEPIRKKLLVSKGLHLTISPVIKTRTELKNIKTIYFDIADYGLLLFERNRTMENFIIAIKKLPYKRSNSQFGEVVEWT
ncbi:MAG: nucleotidyltransferase domain-containing protein [Candidatus Thermoplasmatota archaeon]|nr:nucleotidyltransferase domain-containing protein [Candidatus Thermoplasmatota archaeon]